jgi:hypothetical protein
VAATRPRGTAQAEASTVNCYLDKRLK